MYRRRSASEAEGGEASGSGKKASRVAARSASSGSARMARMSGCSGAAEGCAEGERRRWRRSERTVGLGREGLTQVGCGVGRSALAAAGVGLSWRSVRESGSSWSERERVGAAEEEQTTVGLGLCLVWRRLRRGGERKRKAEEAVGAGNGAMAVVHRKS
nr:unnamed protein product [Digitaria exilis]